MYVVVLENGNLLEVEKKTRWFKTEASKLAERYGGTIRPIAPGDPRF
jgi:hypothetical protein